MLSKILLEVIITTLDKEVNLSHKYIFIVHLPFMFCFLFQPHLDSVDTCITDDTRKETDLSGTMIFDIKHCAALL